MIRLDRFVIFMITLVITIGTTYGNPIGGVVAGGSASFNRTGNTLTVNQTSARAIINWKSFNINRNQTTNFKQPPSGVALNRVTGGTPAMIFGKLLATGQIILIDSSGIFFGPHSYVNVGGIIASTTDMVDSEFLNPVNPHVFNFSIPSSSNAAIINRGNIIARDHGLVALIGSGVSNEGVITAKLGSVILASGNKFTIDMKGDGLVNFVINEGVSDSPTTFNGKPLKNAVNNSGTIMADGGTILLTAKTAQHVLDHVINMSGVAQAQSVDERNGEIIFSAGPTGNVSVSGKVNVAGQNPNNSGGTVKIRGNQVDIASNASIDASGATGGNVTIFGKNNTELEGTINATSQSGAGGTVKILGKDQIHLASTANIDVSGASGGGTILIGGDAKGLGLDPNASATTIDQGASLIANATSQGNGGHIVVWSNHNTQFDGNASAQGGPLGGDGGLIETSGGYINIGNNAQFDTSAAKGQKGEWLLDPVDVYIESASDANSQLANNTYQPVDGNTSPSIINVTTLTNALANNNILITTSAANDILSGSVAGQEGDIYVNAPISWSASTTLTLSAYRNVNINAPISNNSTNAGLIVQTDNTAQSATGANGLINFGTFNAFTGSVSLPNGAVQFYYNPTSIGTATTFSNVTASSFKAYQLINNASDLASLSASPSSWVASENYALNTDLDYTASAAFSNSIIGYGGTPFAGQFNGLNHTINALTILLPSATPAGNYGFFGQTSGTATIQNLGLTNLTLQTSGGMTDTSHVYSVGGLVGYNYGHILNSYTSGSMDFQAPSITTGGLVGTSDSAQGAGTISNSYSTTNISTYINLFTVGSNNIMGGLVGSLQGTSANITQSYAEGTMRSIGATIKLSIMGGLVGVNSGSTISQSFSTGAVLASGGDVPTSVVGGLVGDNSGTIINSYSTGYVSQPSIDSGTEDVGGFIGINTSTGTVSNSYVVGAFTASPPLGVTAILNADVFIGNNSGTVSNSYWDTQSTGRNTTSISTGLTGESTSQMMTQATFNGFDFTPNTGVWSIIPGTSYPYFSFTSPNGTPRVISGSASGGSGTTIQLAVNGSNTAQTSTGANGSYYFLLPYGAIADGDTLFTYITSGPNVANTVTLAPSGGGSITNLSMTNNAITVGDNNTNTLSNSILAAAISNLSGFSILYSSSTNAGNTNLSVSTSNFNVTNTTTYQLDGNINSTGSLNFGTHPLQVTAATTPVTLQFSGNLAGNLSNLSNVILQPAAFGAATLPTASNSSFTINVSNLTTLTTGSGSNNTYNINGAIGTINDTAGSNDTFNLASGVIIGTLNGGTSTTIDAHTTTNNHWILFGNDQGNAATDLGGTITINSFHQVANINGGTGDTFTFNPGSSLGGKINAVSGGTLDYSIFGAAITVNLGNNSASNINSGGNNGFNNSGFNTIIGPDSTNFTNGTLVGGNSSNTWNITSTNGGDVDGVNFSGFGNLVSGNSPDDFKFSDGAGIRGTLTLTTGGDTLDYSAYTTAVNIAVDFDALTVTATNIGQGIPSGFGIFNLNVIGTDSTSATANSTLQYTESDPVTAQISGLNAGVIGDTTFQGFGNLILGPGHGKALDYSTLLPDQTTPITVNITDDTLGQGTASLLSGTFSGIFQFFGTTSSGTTNLFQDQHGGNTWTLSGQDAGTINSVNFSQFSNIQGGPGDTFVIPNGSPGVTGSLSGTGDATLDYSGYGAPVTVTVAGPNISANAVGGNISGVNNFIGSSPNNTNTFQDTTDGHLNWQMTTGTANTGAILNTSNGQVSFSGFGNLAAGNGDVITFQSNSSINGSNAGGAISDSSIARVILNNGASITSTGGPITLATGSSLQYSNFGSAVTVDLTSNSATGITGGFTGFTDFTGPDTSSGANGTLVGPNIIANIWTIGATNVGEINSNAFTFQGFGNLTAQNGDTVNLNSKITGSINDAGTVKVNFNNSGADVAGKITAAAGSTLDYTNFGANVTVDLENSTPTTGIGGIFTGMTNIIGASAGSNTLIDTAGGHTWSLTASTTDTGTVDVNTSTAFSHFGNLTVGSGDTVTLDDNAHLTGSLNSPSNATYALVSGASIAGSVSAVNGKLDYSGFFSQAAVINLNTHTATAIGGTFSGITDFVANANPNSSITNTAGNLSWNITNNNGTINGISFTNFASLFIGNNDTVTLDATSLTKSITSTGSATINFKNGSNVSGSISAVNGKLDYTNFGAAISITIIPFNPGIVSNIGQGFTGITNIIGDTSFSSSNTYLNIIGNNTWNLTSDAGTVGGIAFSHFGTLQGSNNDIFNLSSGSTISGSITIGGVGKIALGNGASITGKIDAASGSTLDYTTFGSTVLVDLANSTATNTGGLANGSGFTHFIGPDGTTGTNGTLVAPNTASANTWLFTASATNQGSVNGDTFQGFGNYTGGTNENITLDGSTITGTLATTGSGTFALDNGANVGAITAGGIADIKFNSSSSVVQGTVNGATGSTLDYHAFGSAVLVDLANNTATNTGGLASGNGFTNFIGPDGTTGTSSKLIGPNGPNSWTLDSPNGGTINSAITLAGFGNVMAGPSGDAFTISSSINTITGSVVGSNSYTLQNGANVDTINGGGGPNTFFIQGGFVNQLIGGAFADNLLSINTTTNKIILNDNGTSGSINVANGPTNTGAAVVNSFTNIASITSSDAGDTLNINTALTNLTTAPGTTINIGSGGSITGLLTVGANSMVTINGTVGAVNAGPGSTVTINPGSTIIGTVTGAPGASLIDNTSTAATTWNINGTSGTSSNGITYSNIDSLTASGTFNVMGNVPSLTGGSNLVNTFNLANGATIGNLVGGSANEANIINLQAYTQALTITLLDKINGGWQGSITNVISNFINLGQATAAAGTGSTILVPLADVKSIIYNLKTHSGMIPDPFVFNNFDPTQFNPSSPTATTNSVLAYANQIVVFPPTITPEQAQFDWVINNLPNIQSLEPLDILIRQGTQFGCLAP